jgi:hypothetical protein
VPRLERREAIVPARNVWACPLAHSYRPSLVRPNDCYMTPWPGDMHIINLIIARRLGLTFPLSLPGRARILQTLTP